MAKKDTYGGKVGSVARVGGAAKQDPAERVAKKIGEKYDYSKLLRPKAEQLAEHQRGLGRKPKPKSKPKEPVMGPPAPPKPKPKPVNPYARETAAQSEQATRAYDQEVSFRKEQKARKSKLAPKLGITQSAPSSRQQQKSAQTKRKAAASAKSQAALKTGTVNRKKKTFGASATRGVTPGDQSTPGRGDRR
jgi:outer membrane biosynthesis protein TonB